ncbi:Protein of unknown function [Cotesia congregata]|uniref:Uncharacterized protein n=1 Tax=Cotesia congregata TaxID=51543 RepID=A0A8J2H2Y3_COTCN|nr:Protein of unknown function [Cotesia congregata]
MEQINNLTNSKSTNPQIESEELLDLLERYEIYRNQTLEERHDHDKLYNITSGKNAAPEIEEFLLNVEKIGDDARKTFITECIEYPERYSLPIKRQKVQTFVNTVKKKKVAVSGRVQEKTLQNLYIVDGLLFINSLKEIPRTFGDLSKKILSSLCKISATGIDVIFDRQFIPSINDTNKCISGRSEREFKILGSNQVRPSDFAKEMKNSKFKEALISFFLKHWQESDYNILGDKIININFDVLRWP